MATLLMASDGGDPYWWVDLVVNLGGCFLMFLLGAFWGRVRQIRRFSQWATENPHEVYRLAEELRKAELRQGQSD